MFLIWLAWWWPWRWCVGIFVVVIRPAPCGASVSPSLLFFLSGRDEFIALMQTVDPYGKFRNQFVADFFFGGKLGEGGPVVGRLKTIVERERERLAVRRAVFAGVLRCGAVRSLTRRSSPPRGFF